MNEFTKTIVEWYEENKRELPWRESADPYLIWISEIILQQTRVAQGYDYFLRFINLFAAAVYSPTPFRASTSGYVFGKTPFMLLAAA